MLHNFGENRYLDPLSIESVVVDDDYSDNRVSAYAVLVTMRTGVVYKWRYSYRSSPETTYEQDRAAALEAKTKAVMYQHSIVKLVDEVSKLP